MSALSTQAKQTAVNLAAAGLTAGQVADYFGGNTHEQEIREAVQVGTPVAAGASPNATLATLLGNLRQSGAPGRPARSNIGLGTVVTDGALASTGVGCFTPVPVAIGDVISSIAFQVAGTAGGTMTHQFAALYKGTGTEPALIGQSVDTTSAAIAEKTRKTYTLATPVTINEENAPFGFIYVELAITASQMPSAAVFATAAGINYQWAANCPLFFSFTAGSALGATAAAKIESAAAKVVAPAIILS